MDPEEMPSDLLRPFPADEMTMWPVSTAVNSPKNDSRDLIEPISLDRRMSADENSGVPLANEAGAEPSNSV